MEDKSPKLYSKLNKPRKYLINNFKDLKGEKNYNHINNYKFYQKV